MIRRAAGKFWFLCLAVGKFDSPDHLPGPLKAPDLPGPFQACQRKARLVSLKTNGGADLASPGRPLDPTRPQKSQDLGPDCLFLGRNWIGEGRRAQALPRAFCTACQAPAAIWEALASSLASVTPRPDSKASPRRAVASRALL